jgi:spore germination protein GerM
MPSRTFPNRLLLLVLLVTFLSSCSGISEQAPTEPFLLPATSTQIFTITPPDVVTATLPPTATFTPVPPTFTPVPPTVTLPPTATLPPTPTETLSSNTVNLYFIALDDGGEAGEEIGCNDSLVPVLVNIEPTTGVLRAALEKLLSTQTRTYGATGYYHSLYQSNLSIESVSVQNGEAVLRLNGELILGGVCDSPRVQAQLEAIALQFSTVNSVSIFINGETLAEVLSQNR